MTASEHGRPAIAAAPDSSIGVFAQPTIRVRGGWIAAFSLAWLGIWMGQLAPLQLLLPAQVARQLPADSWVTTVVYFGLVSGIACLFTVIVYPLTGALSDRTTSRFGRRRPWIAVGLLTLAGGLSLLGLQTTLVGVIVFWSMSLIGFCIASAALSAMISDRVPEDQRGLVSGWISAPNAVGILLGMVLVTAVFTDQAAGYLAIAVLVVLFGIPFLAVTEDTPLTSEQRAAMTPITPRTIGAALWISPRRYPDFGWTLLSRVLVNLGNAMATTMLLYFFAFGLELAEPEGFLIQTTLIYMGMTILSALLLGKLSDVIGRRKLFVLGAGCAQAISAILLSVAPSTSTAIVCSVLLGLGQGCFFAVDQALATEVLPNPDSRGKDLGIMNVALAVPQAFGPLVGAAVVVAFGSFGGLFLVSGVIGLAGAILILKVRAVR